MISTCPIMIQVSFSTLPTNAERRSTNVDVVELLDKLVLRRTALASLFSEDLGRHTSNAKFNQRDSLLRCGRYALASDLPLPGWLQSEGNTRLDTRALAERAMGARSFISGSTRAAPFEYYSQSALHALRVPPRLRVRLPDGGEERLDGRPVDVLH